MQIVLCKGISIQHYWSVIEYFMYFHNEDTLKMIIRNLCCWSRIPSYHFHGKFPINCTLSSNIFWITSLSKEGPVFRCAKIPAFFWFLRDFESEYPCAFLKNIMCVLKMIRHAQMKIFVNRVNSSQTSREILQKSRRNFCQKRYSVIEGQTPVLLKFNTEHRSNIHKLSFEIYILFTKLVTLRIRRYSIHMIPWVPPS